MEYVIRKVSQANQRHVLPNFGLLLLLLLLHLEVGEIGIFWHTFLCLLEYGKGVDHLRLCKRARPEFHCHFKGVFAAAPVGSFHRRAIAELPSRSDAHMPLTCHAFIRWINPYPSGIG